MRNFKYFLVLVIFLSSQFLYAENQVNYEQRDDGSVYAYTVSTGSNSGNTTGNESGNTTGNETGTTTGSETTGSGNSGGTVSGNNSNSSENGGNQTEGGGKTEQENALTEEAKKEIEEAERIAKEAEADVDRTLVKYKSIREKYNKCSSAMNTMSYYSQAERENLIREYSAAEKDFKVWESCLENKAECMTEAYTKLGEVYDKYNYSGDPVQVCNGNYNCEYVDFEAQDYLKVFVVLRNLYQDNWKESFGKNWNCSLDSRIVRCNYQSWDNYLSCSNTCLEYLNQMEHSFDEYNQKYPDKPSDSYETCMKEVETLRQEQNQLRKIIDARISMWQNLNNLNKYVTYGRYSDPSSYEGTEMFLKYLDEKGNEYQFYLVENGKWKSAGTLSSEIMEITNRSDGGYVLSKTDGSKKEFSVYGVLEKETDNNGNVNEYFSNQGRINQIKLKSGEVLSVNRNNSGYIISIEGTVSGKTSYVYSGAYLISATDNAGVKTSYSYDSNGCLKQINKADKTSIKLEYEFESDFNKFVCSCVTNENEEKEYFDWVPENMKMKHQTYGNQREVYTYNQNGNTISYSDYCGNLFEFQVNEYGLITDYIENGFKKSFVYDNKYRPVKISDSNGGVTTLSYNNQDLITSIVDSDGNKTSFEYDKNGNIIKKLYNGYEYIKFDYYSNGLIKSVYENDCIEKFEYNAFGSVTKKTTTDNKNLNKKQEWTYDSKNRLIQYIDELGLETTITYGLHQITSVFNSRRKTIITLDAKNREIEKKTIDILTGEEHTKKTSYDKRGNIFQIYYDNQLIEEYLYDSDKKVSEVKKWNFTNENSNVQRQGIQWNYEYGKYGFLKSEKKGFVPAVGEMCNFRTVDCKLTSGKWNICITDYSGRRTEYLFDNDGKLLQIKNADGSYETRTYTKTGRLKTVSNSSMELWSYTYGRNGEINVSLSKNGKEIFKNVLDRFGNPVTQWDILNNKKTYSYDCLKRLVCEKTDTTETVYEYDAADRKISKNIYESSGNLCFSQSISYDDKNGVVKILNGENCIELCKVDAWHRPVEITDKKGKKNYQYNCRNEVISVTDGNGLVTKFDYDALGKCAGIKNPENHQIYIEKDITGNNIKQFTEDKVLYECNWNLSAGKMSEKNLYGDIFSYLFDFETGQYIPEGCVEKPAAEESLVKSGITRNSLGLITKIENADCNLLYDYDIYGKLISVEDGKNNLKIEYFYDNFGRCIEKQSTAFDFCYEYDSCGRINKISDLITKTSVCLEYNSSGYVTLVEYSNGIRIEKKYDKNNLVESIVVRNSSNEILKADLLVRNDNGKISVICDEKGQWQTIDYFDDGKIHEVTYPYSESLVNFYYQEAVTCGAHISKDTVEPVHVELSQKDKNCLEQIMDNADCRYYIPLNKWMNSWKDSFEYNLDDTLKSVENGFGKILYEYDQHFRPVWKHCGNSINEGIHLVWDEKGRLTDVKSQNYKILMKYNEVNRLVSLNYLDNITSEKKCWNYTYDSLGRRISQNSETSATSKFIYDGLSFNVIQVVTDIQNQVSGSQLWNTNDNQNNSMEEYRWIDTMEYSPFGSGKNVRSTELPVETPSREENTRKQTFYNRPYVLMNLNNIPLMFLAADNRSMNGFSVEYLVGDYKNNLTGAFDESQECVETTFYDIWGNIPNGEGLLAFNTCSTQKQSGISLYNLGYRDYSPGLKTFTTEDPLKDGFNWYAYCLKDCVNYLDPTGGRIIPVDNNYYMTDYAGVLLGNSSTETMNKYGCYVVTLANVAKTLQNYGVTNNTDFDDPIKINNHKNLFVNKGDKEDFGNICRDPALDAITGGKEHDYWTRNGSTTAVLKAEMKKYEVSRKNYIIMGIFDLTETGTGGSNHMVALNSNFDEDGYLDNEEQLTVSSRNDYVRFQNGYLDKYNLSNLKGIWLTEVPGDQSCNK